MSKTTSLIRYKRGLNNNIMQCKRYPLPRKLRSRLRYFDIWNNKLYGILKLISFRLLRSQRIFLTILRRFAAKNQEKPLAPGQVGRLGRSPSLLWEGLHTTYLLVRARANLDNDALNKVGFTPLSTLSFSPKDSLTI